MLQKKEKKHFLAEVIFGKTTDQLVQRRDLLLVSSQYTELGDIISAYATKIGAKLNNIITDYSVGHAWAYAKIAVWNDRNFVIHIRRLPQVIKIE